MVATVCRSTYIQGPDDVERLANKAAISLVDKLHTSVPSEYERYVPQTLNV